MDSSAATEVADFLHGVLYEQHLAPADLLAWEGVRDALWAFGNDTDQIIHLPGQGDR
jgi:hypothetical protein